MVDVDGLCASAPALEMMRPAGMAPLRSAQTKSLRDLVLLLGGFHRGQGFGDPAIGVLNFFVDRIAGFGLQLVLAFPDVFGGFLKRDVVGEILNLGVH